MSLDQRQSVARILLAGAIATICQGCIPQKDSDLEPEGFTDNFERVELGTAWHNTGGPYTLINGELHVQGARNHPLWLRRTLPDDVQIEFDVVSRSPAGDIKWEINGDGLSWAKTLSYTATGYVVVLGGWNNTLNIIARMNEHGADRTVGSRRPLHINERYRIRVEKRGGEIKVWANGMLLLERHDPQPLKGRGHDHFAFNNWESSLIFDNLKIKPL